MSDDLTCNDADSKDRLTCIRAMDEIEERRETRKMRFWVVRFTLIVISLVALAITFGGLYGWLFKEKEFLDGGLGMFFSHTLSIIKIVFGM